MEYIELSLENVKEKSNDLYKIIKKDSFNYDLVIFIAKGSYPIGRELSTLNEVPLLEVCAARKGGNFKKFLGPLLKILPRNVLIKIRKMEMTSNFHEKNNDRQIDFNVNIYKKYKNCKNILLVDDSIDSGLTILKAKDTLTNYFNGANIKIAVFNVMSKSIIKADYNLFDNILLNGPWSNDSKYSNEFYKNYNEWKNKYEG